MNSEASIPQAIGPVWNSHPGMFWLANQPDRRI